MGLLLIGAARAAEEPYPDLSGGSYSGPAVPDSPDPLVSYRWPSVKSSDGFQCYVIAPKSAQSDAPAAFANLESLTGKQVNVAVNSTGSIRLDFGQENAGWLEFDSPDMAGKVEASISEFNEPAIDPPGPENPVKTKALTRHGNTYRLELNRDLYEGVRFAWIHVRTHDRPWHITGVRLVCQIKPSNYTGSFSCSDPELTRIWYTGAYTVKLNLLKNYFGAILMDRGDRISWTGDAYVAQAAALVAFGDNIDFVKTNLKVTANDSNGIASYSLCWVLSLVDYFNYSGDKAMLDQYLGNASVKLNAAYEHFDHPPHLTFFGWDDRVGAGFENADIAEARHAYQMLSIRAWREFARAMEQSGRLDLRDKYVGYANEKSSQIKKDPAWLNGLGAHAAADAINAGLATADEQNTLFTNALSDRVQRVSFSPFNQYFILQAMGAANKTDDALATVKDCWGGQLRLGATTFLEVYDPSWNGLIAQNDAVPNNQCGSTSLCHPWSAGVVKWLTEETLGIKPTSAGFATYAVRPHLGRTLTRVSGQVQTPHGLIAATVDTATGICTFIAPEGTEGDFFIPKVEKTIDSVRINGALAWSGKVDRTVAGVGEIQNEADYIRLGRVRPGTYAIEVVYSGATPAALHRAWGYAVNDITQDSTTHGRWGGKYGRDGFVLFGYDEAGGKATDRQQLPDYVTAVKCARNATVRWQAGTSGPAALAVDVANTFPRNAGCIFTQGTGSPTMTIDVNFKSAAAHQVAIYVVDWDKKGRRETIELFDAVTLQRLAPAKMIRDFTGGKYLVYHVEKSVRFRVNQVRGDNATVSGIFFD